MAQRIVKKSLAGRQDILFGNGQVTQQRAGGSYPINKVSMVWACTSHAELLTIDTEQFTQATVNYQGAVTHWGWTGTNWYCQETDLILIGSFEVGFTFTSANQVGCTASGIYSWSGVLPKTVASGTDPTVVAGYVPRTDVVLRSELTSTGNTPEEIGASAYVPTGLDLTGATDESAAIAALWSKWQIIRLPKGKIRADISVPTGCVLLGSGQQAFDRTSSTWNGNGTLVVGTIDQSGIVGWTIANLSVDNYGSGGNAIVGLAPDTGFGYLKNVTTRANNHGQLWEANDDNPSNSNAIGNIVAEDCLHYGGPNGFVTKHKRVSFIRCLAYDVTVQGVVVVSDNINGPSVYSRAQNTLVENCATYGCNEGLRIYSRDYGSTGSVLGAYDTKVVGQTGSGFTGRKIRIGDFTEGGSYSRVVSIVNRFRDLPYDSTSFSCIHLDYADRTDFKGCHWGYQANVSTGVGVGQLDCDPADNHIRAGSSLTGGTALGVESGRHLETGNSATITPLAKQRFIILQNTVSTTITNIAGANIGYDVTIVIDDAFSTVAVSGVLHSGKGTVCRMRYNGTGWVDLGEYRQRSSTEKTAGGSAAAAVFDLSSGSLNQLWTANGVSITSVTLAGTAGISAGEELTLRITNGGSSPTVTISGWDAAIKWPDGSSAPASLAVARKLIVKLTCIGGGVFVATSQTIYV